MSPKNRNDLVGSTVRYMMMNYKVLGGTGSVWGGTGWYLVVMGQYRVLLVDI